jgi:hypothetical protein
MKPYLFSILVTIWLFAILRAIADNTTLTLAWNPSTGGAGGTTYNLWWGTNSGVYFTNESAGSITSLTISNLIPGITYYFVVNAVDTNQSISTYSNEVTNMIHVAIPVSDLHIVTPQ